MNPLRLLSLSCLTFVSLGLLTASAQTTATGSSGCKADNAPVSDAEAALFLEDWGRASRLYRATLATNPKDLTALTGLVRVQLGQGNIADALKDATTLTTTHPDAGIAQEALGETYLRRGEISAALPVISRALSLDPCSARAHLLEGRLQTYLGYHASAGAQYSLAHRLRPADEQITGAWMFTLPPEQRIASLKQFMEQAKYLNADDREDLKSNVLRAEAHLNSHCTVSSPASGTHVPLHLNPILGNSPGEPTFDALVNGKKHRVSFGTSSSDITLKPGTAERLGLKPSVKVSYANLWTGGRTNFAYTTLDSFRVGDVEYRNCIVEILDEHDEAVDEQRYDNFNNSTGADMEIGAMFFSDFQVNVDPAGKQLNLVPLPSPNPATDHTGLPTWSDVSKSAGNPVPSINGGGWALYNRKPPEAMKDWAQTIEYRDRTWLPTVIGGGPPVLFELELATPVAHVSTAASGSVARLETLTANGKPPFKGYFYEFAGLFFPIDSWTATRFDRFNQRMYLETSGYFGQNALRQTSFSIDYRDNLVHFERTKN